VALGQNFKSLHELKKYAAYRLVSSKPLQFMQTFD